MTLEKEWDQEFPKEPPLIQGATDLLMQNYKFLTIEETEEILYYQDGVYVSRGQKLIEKQTEAMYGNKLKNANIGEIIGHIKRRTYHKSEELDADINIINTKNGLYDIRKGILLKHDPNYLSINQKPIIFDKKAKPKLFGQFLKEVLYSREVRTAVEAMAYTFHRDCPIETLFMLFGKGSNGKTVYTKILTAMHGTDNVSYIPLSEMLGDRFALADLEGKDVNIDNELAGQTIKEASVLKRLTGGSRQKHRVQRKNQQAYNAMLHAKLFFNANRIPDSQDISDAFNRRVITISFPKTFEGEMEDKTLIDKLTNQEELSGIFNVLMSALRYILKTKQLYVNEKTIEEKRIKYERAVNPTKAFIEEAVYEDLEETCHIPKMLFYNAYVSYCKEYTLPYESYDLHCKNLKKDFGFKNRESKPTVDGKRIHCWKGINLIPKYDPKTTQLALTESCPPCPAWKAF